MGSPKRQTTFLEQVTLTPWSPQGELRLCLDGFVVNCTSRMSGIGKIQYPGSRPERIHALPELLAPAGDWECAKAAVENGADAIYFGLEKFNARMRADNFTEPDLPRLMEFLHR